MGRVNFGQVPTAARDTVRCGSGDAAARRHGMGRRAADGGRPTAGASRETKKPAVVVVVGSGVPASALGS